MVLWLHHVHLQLQVVSRRMRKALGKIQSGKIAPKIILKKMRKLLS